MVAIGHNLTATARVARKRLVTGLGLVVASVSAVAGCAETPGSAAPTGSVAQLLARVRVVPSRPDPAGYDRSCRAGHRCVFGPAWTDAHNGAGGRDGCDTRNNVLAAQLRDVVRRPGSRCVVIRGTLDDPYTGRTISWSKARASAVQIDHIVSPCPGLGPGRGDLAGAASGRLRQRPSRQPAGRRRVGQRQQGRQRAGRVAAGQQGIPLHLRAAVPAGGEQVPPGDHSRRPDHRTDDRSLLPLTWH